MNEQMFAWGQYLRLMTKEKTWDYLKSSQSIYDHSLIN